MDEHFRIRGRRWRTWPCQRVLFDLMADDRVPTLTCQKSKRVGYTSGLVAAALYDAVRRRRSGAIWQPVEGDASEFKKDEIDPRLREVEIVREAMRADPEGRSPHNTLDRVAFEGDAVLYLRGGKSGKSYRRISVDSARYDELDAFPPDVDGEGDPTVLGDGRTEQSPYPKSIRGSTPRVKEESLIEKSMAGADMVLRRHLPCPHCGALHALEWERFRYERAAPRETAAFLCPHCEESYGYHQFAAMDRAGRWVADAYDAAAEPAALAGYWVDDDTMQLHAPDGARARWPHHVGIFIWAAYSYLRGWGDMAHEWVEANRQHKATGDNTGIKTFVNTSRAETWHEGADELNADRLMERREAYAAEVPAGALVLVAGVDVQPDRLEVEVLGAGPNFERWGIEYRVLLGDPDERDVWDQLDQLRRERVYVHESGSEMRIVATAIDSGGSNTQSVYEYCRLRSHERVYCIKGQGGAGLPLVKAPSNQKTVTGHRVKLFVLGVDGFKRRLLGSNEGPGLLGRSRGEPGYQHIPESYTRNWCQGLLSEVYRRKFVAGKWVAKWWQIARRNEPLDIRNYAEAALEILNPLWSALAAQYQPPDPDGDPQEPKAEQRSKRRRRPRRGGFVNNW